MRKQKIKSYWVFHKEEPSHGFVVGETTKQRAAQEALVGIAGLHYSPAMAYNTLKGMDWCIEVVNP